MESVSFTKMEDGTAEEYAFLTPLYNNCLNGVSDTLLKLLKQMQGDKLGYKIDRYTHSLQSATRAERDGADEETIVCTLLHDIGDLLAPQNHSQVAASILRPYISEKYKDHPYYQSCVKFCHKWDQCSFDPDYDTFPLEHFEPMVRNVLSKPLNTFD